MTWTWLDLLLAVKSRTRESLVTQAIKQKFLRTNKSNTKEEQVLGTHSTNIIKEKYKNNWKQNGEQIIEALFMRV